VLVVITWSVEKCLAGGIFSNQGTEPTFVDPWVYFYTLSKLDLKKHGFKRKKDLSTVKERGPTQQVFWKSKHVQFYWTMCFNC
jgi:hypothetical protein